MLSVEWRHFLLNKYHVRVLVKRNCGYQTSSVFIHLQFQEKYNSLLSVIPELKSMAQVRCKNNCITFFKISGVLILSFTIYSCIWKQVILLFLWYSLKTKFWIIFSYFLNSFSARRGIFVFQAHTGQRPSRHSLDGDASGQAEAGHVGEYKYRLCFVNLFEAKFCGLYSTITISPAAVELLKKYCAVGSAWTGIDLRFCPSILLFKYWPELFKNQWLRGSFLLTNSSQWFVCDT